MKELKTFKQIEFEKLICNTPQHYGTPLQQKIAISETLHMALINSTWKVFIREVPLTLKGYDRGGACWGNSRGKTLFVAHAVFSTSRLKAAGFGVTENTLFFDEGDDRTAYVDYYWGASYGEVTARQDAIAQIKSKYQGAWVYGEGR